MNIIDQLSEIGIVPVVVIDDADDAVPLAKVLKEGGLPCAEITFRTQAAAESISKIAEELPDFLVGAGTVITKDQVDLAIESGAKFLVAPGFDQEIIKYAQNKGVPYIPGVCTPTEIQNALSLGITDLKFFPAEAFGGLKTLKALCGAFPQIRFMPTGGISLDNVKAYLQNEKIYASGGSWMVKSNLIQEKRFDEILKLTKQAAKVVQDVKSMKNKIYL
ncbi:MAG: bifunctional 4-hydroxy-2-oxoglutarate aldolase/2-dehydro-3-deoxy-phosphogluconate aldolase [Erysipelotrichaceae bacterium]|nr:bifunctional 4-hydroxy-2-oxoglutarate aldolase/2-dehydro-3-deoxy-phosphogluconate aldolase [Erysipelotrichaceae bacterium]MDY6035036.1 bifunctional 4-hydroxy-2-oxoglutarate aldolase/2-dehydro-3-deoxy-phosphogluconate aldolase [Bulleidia sp.]